jgi:5'-methylthioadenosine phosphorylase
VDATGAVSQDEVFRVFGENTERLRGLLLNVAAALPAERGCPCPHVLDGIETGLELP